MGAIRAYDSLKTLCGEIVLKKPDRITSVNLRKYMATVSQVGTVDIFTPPHPTTF